MKTPNTKVVFLCKVLTWQQQQHDGHAHSVAFAYASLRLQSTLSGIAYERH